MKPLTERMGQVLRILAKYSEVRDPLSAKEIALRVGSLGGPYSARAVVPALRALQVRGLACEVTAYDPPRYVITPTGADVASTIPTAAERFLAGEGVPLNEFLIDGAFPKLKQ